MSHSPTVDRIGDNEQAYVDAWRHVNQLLRSGRSFSGRERNCAYLNLRGKRFANVSSVTGFDSPSDGRSIATTDWDRDGDLDVWSTNRNAPRLRLLVNEMGGSQSRERNYVSVLLVGNSADCNRDAIGARVELFVQGNPDGRLVRTVRAGSGYLSQSSRWLHFGLGAIEAVQRIQVNWPNGQVDNFAAAAVNTRYTLTQQSPAQQSPRETSQAIAVASRAVRIATPERVPTTTTTTTTPTLATHNLLAKSFPLPPLTYQRLDGTPVDAAAHRSRPLLMNLWSTDCPTCCAELGEWASWRSPVSNENLNHDLAFDVVAASTNLLDTNSHRSIDDVRNLVKKLKLPFTVGTIDSEALQTLQLVHNVIYDHDRQLPVPTSFLIDTRGHLAAIYKGPVDLDRIRRDVRQLELNDAQRLAAALPSAGRWVASPSDYAYSAVLDQLLARGLQEDAAAFAKRLDQQIQSNGDDAFQVKLLVANGIRLAREGSTTAAVEQLRQALRLSPNSARAHFELGTILGRQSQFEEAIYHLKSAVQLDERFPDAKLNLAIALRKVNQADEAIRYFEEALALDPNLKPAHTNLALTYGQQGDLPKAVDHFRKTVELDPDDVDNRFNLAVALLKLQQPTAAMAELTATLERSPDLPIALTLMAEILSREQGPQAAVALLEPAVRRTPQVAPLHAMLAGYLEQTGSMANALSHYREAERLDRGNLRSLMRIAWILSTAVEPELRNGKNAVRYGRRAIEKSPNDVAVLDVLAAAYAEAGDFDSAVKTAERAEQIAENRQLVREHRVLQDRLKLYRDQKPYRMPSRP